MHALFISDLAPKKSWPSSCRVMMSAQDHEIRKLSHIPTDKDGGRPARHGDMYRAAKHGGTASKVAEKVSRSQSAAQRHTVCDRATPSLSLQALCPAHV